MTLIQLNNVTKSYKKGDSLVTPLENLDLQIEQGEFVALMGPSGSGKTTLLNLIGGIDQPTKGQVMIAGQDISLLSRSKLANWRAEHVGYIFQLYHLVPVLTAYENVELPLLLHRISSAERKRRVNTALEAVGLLDRYDHYPRQLSGGQEQRVAIARALVTNPTIIVGDEPTGDLDKKSADATLQLLRRLNTELGKTLIIVTHDPHAAAAADRVVHLEKGVIVDEPETGIVDLAAARTTRIAAPAAISISTDADAEPVSALGKSVAPQRKPSPTAEEFPDEGKVTHVARKRRPWAAIAAAVLLVAGGGGFFAWKANPFKQAAVTASGEQITEIRVKDDTYIPDTLTVSAGTPVLLKITKEDERHCADVFEIPQLGIKETLTPFKTTEIRFTPDKSGTIPFQCGMDMMHGKIQVASK